MEASHASLVSDMTNLIQVSFMPDRAMRGYGEVSHPSGARPSRRITITNLIQVELPESGLQEISGHQ
jgi:hypothetical protein